MKMKTLAAAAAIFAISAPVLAEGKLTLSDLLSTSDITVSGRVDASYDYANTKGATGQAPLFNYFQTESNSFVLHQAAINIAKAPTTGFGAAVTLLVGEDAKVLNTFNSPSTQDFSLLQGYLSYTQGAISVIGGRFVTLAGAEVIDSSANFNATRGLLFSVQPTYHNGVRGTYKLSDNLSFTGGIVNSFFAGNAASLTPAPRQKTIELNATYTVVGITNSLTSYVGKENSVSGTGQSLLIDYVGTYPVDKDLALVLNADYFASQTTNSHTADGYGVAGYVNYKIDAVNRVAGRVEYLHNNDATVFASFPPYTRNLSAVTVTLGHALISNLEMLVEARADLSGSDAAFNTAQKNNQYTGTVKAIYKF